MTGAAILEQEEQDADQNQVLFYRGTRSCRDGTRACHLQRRRCCAARRCRSIALPSTRSPSIPAAPKRHRRRGRREASSCRPHRGVAVRIEGVASSTARAAAVREIFWFVANTAKAERGDVEKCGLPSEILRMCSQQRLIFGRYGHMMVGLGQGMVGRGQGMVGQVRRIAERRPGGNMRIRGATCETREQQGRRAPW
ncbi:uncharacterized protein SCHCODRAFT_02198700 [Schizophyllum commune H4-8]|uniref:uncharacterized protein n=1 Tax=Schizophyllum commune (strain H4-8 / FGSC 9210) TaxID=578458 RepID=UPI00215ED5DC|nr:uncharacterized protein SCHCODRAFT_02198700 [Schizophyllum commune H4-8]KAI5896773.1 hypothetical protein SCHCODRAFT_02198700 [Schizophyllum commune H4-8]